MDGFERAKPDVVVRSWDDSRSSTVKRLANKTLSRSKRVSFSDKPVIFELETSTHERRKSLSCDYPVKSSLDRTDAGPIANEEIRMVKSVLRKSAPSFLGVSAYKPGTSRSERGKASETFGKLRDGLVATDLIVDGFYFQGTMTAGGGLPRPP